MPVIGKMNEYIKILVSKYVSGTLSDEEAVRLAKWIKMSGNNAELFRNAVRDMEKNRTTTSDAVEFWNRLAKDKFSANAGSKKTSGIRGQNMPALLPLHLRSSSLSQSCS